MNAIEKLIREIPFFRHFTSSEISQFFTIGRLSQIRKNQVIDLKKTNSFNLVVKGIFESENAGKKDVVYITSGSFFGTIPFSEQSQRGTLRALCDSTLLIYGEEELYRFFLGSWKGLRGYIRSIEKLGFNVSPAGRKYFGENSRIISVYGNAPSCGKSFMASVLGMAMAKSGRTIILDLSYSGSSIFNIFDKKITSPLSQKQVDGPSIEELIHSRIVEVSDTLHLINISFGSKVKVNPAILSPVLFVLSKSYRYILTDLSDYDSSLRDRAFELSDIIFSIVGRKKYASIAHDMFNSRLVDAQRVFYTANEHVTGRMKIYDGGLILQKYTISPGDNQLEQLGQISAGENISRFVHVITEKKRALIFETSLLESVYYAGFLSASEMSGQKFNYFYSSSYGYILMVLYIVSRDIGEFKKRVVEFFSERRINNLLEIVFPEQHIFKKDRLMKYSAELCGESRIENFKTIPVAKLMNSATGSSRLFSTGLLKEIFASSFLIYPAFEPQKLGSEYFDSGYPLNSVQVEDMFRSDIDEIVHVSVNSSETMEFKNERVLNFYKKYIDNLSAMKFAGKVGTLADKNIVIDASEKKLKVEKIIEISEKSYHKNIL